MDSPSRQFWLLIAIYAICGLDDFFVAYGDLYPNGRLIHDMYLVEVKKPAEVTEQEDFLKLLATVPALEAFGP